MPTIATPALAIAAPTALPTVAAAFPIPENTFFIFSPAEELSLSKPLI